MQAFVSSEGPSAQQYTENASVLCPKFCVDITQSVPMPSGRAKKRERDEKGLEPKKRERLDKSIKSSSVRETVWNLDLSNLVGKDGGLRDLACVGKLICLMQHAWDDGVDKRIDVVLERRILINIILSTQQADCLNKFVKLGGLPLLDEWLQDVLKSKPGDNECPREWERVSEDLILVLLCTLERLPVDLVSLQTCSVGNSVNSLWNYRHVEIQKKARKLVEVWKKRVEVKQSNELNVVLNHGLQLPIAQHMAEHNLPLQLKEVEVFDLAGIRGVCARSVPQISNSIEVVAQGESSCTVVEKFASVSSFSSAGVGDNQRKSPSSLSDKSLCKPSQTTDLELLWYDATVKSTNTGLIDCDGKGKCSLTVHLEENVKGSGSCVKDGKGNAGSCKPASVDKASVLRCRNGPLEISGHNVHSSDIETFARVQNGNLDNLPSFGVVPPLYQNSLHAICGSSIIEMHMASGGSLSPCMSDNHAHLDLGDRTAGRKKDTGRTVSSPKRNTEKSCSASLSLKPMDIVTGEAKFEGYIIDVWKSRKSLPADGQAVGSNKIELKESDVLSTSSVFSNANFSQIVNNTSEGATAGINLLASVAVNECSTMEMKVHTSLSEKRSSTLGAALISKESSFSPRARPIHEGKVLDSGKVTIPRETSGFSTEREQFDRISSTVSSPSDAETKPHPFISEGVCCSNGCLSVEAPTAIDTASDGRSPISDSGKPTSNILKASTVDPSGKQSVQCFSIDQSNYEELCRLQSAYGKADKQFTSSSSLIAETMGESSTSEVVEADALKEIEDGKVLEAEQVQRRISTISFQRESNSLSRTFGDHVRKLDRQVSMEVKRERLNSAGSFSDAENSDGFQICGSTVMELPSATFTIVEDGEVSEYCSRQPSGTHVSTSFQPKTVEWNLNYALNEKTECVKSRTLDQAESASVRAVLERGSVTFTDENKKPGARGRDPANLQVLMKDEAAVQMTAPHPQILQKVSYTAEKADADTLEKNRRLASVGIDGLKRNGKLRRLEFDLNEGPGCELPCCEEGFLQDSSSSLSCLSGKGSAVRSCTGPAVPIAIVAATKGAFIPPANPFRLTGEAGWKGSAATSAFRPALPRRNAEKHNGAAQTRVADNCPDVRVAKPLLNFDLNVAADTGCEDAATERTTEIPSKLSIQDTNFASGQPLIAHSVTVEAGSYLVESSINGVARPIWDLNYANEHDNGDARLASQVRSVECLRTFKDSKNNLLDFDLNNGPLSQDQDEFVASAGSGNDFQSTEPSTFETRLMTGAPDEESVACGRKAGVSVNPYLLGSTESFGCAGTKDGPFQCNIYRRGHTIPSSEVGYPSPPSTGYSSPFGFTPTSFCTLSAPFVDSSEVQPFPAVPPAMLSSEALISSKSRPPYLMGAMDVILPTGDSIWGRPSLDLNFGPEVVDADAKDDSSSSWQFSTIAGFGAHRRGMQPSVEVIDHLKKNETNGCWGIQTALLERWQYPQ